MRNRLQLCPVFILNGDHLTMIIHAPGDGFGIFQPALSQTMPVHGPKDYMDHTLSPAGSLHYSNSFWEEKGSYTNVSHDLPGGFMGQKMHHGLF